MSTQISFRLNCKYFGLWRRNNCFSAEQLGAQLKRMSATANSFLRLNSTVSQPGSPISLKGEQQRLSRAGSSALAGGGSSLNGVNKSVSGGGSARLGGRCGPLLRYLSSNPRMRTSLGHIGLVILLACYTAAGASVSHFLIPSVVINMYWPLNSKFNFNVTWMQLSSYIIRFQTCTSPHALEVVL